MRERERYEAERKNADRVRDRDDQAEQSSVRGRPSLADKVGGDDRLAVARGEGVGGAPEDGGGERCQDDEGAQVRAADERGEGRVGDAIGCLEATAARKTWCHSGPTAGRQRGLGVRAPTTISLHPMRSL